MKAEKIANSFDVLKSLKEYPRNVLLGEKKENGMGKKKENLRIRRGQNRHLNLKT